MTQFNLKKKKSRERFFFDKNNIISEIGNELIFDKVSFIKKDLNQVLVIDNYELKDHPKILNYQYSEFEEVGEKNSFDGILSNFKVAIFIDFLSLLSINTWSKLGSQICKRFEISTPTAHAAKPWTIAPNLCVHMNSL